MTNGPDLLNGLSAVEAGRLRALGTAVRVPASQPLFRLGGVADSVFVIERGRVTLTLPMELRGRDQELALEERGAGQTVGWSGLIPPNRFTLTATALEDTDVLVLPRAALTSHFEANPDVGYLIMRNVACIVGQRLQVFRTMWLREMQRVVKLSHA
jgi:CRP-like cAMP-binding protein